MEISALESSPSDGAIENLVAQKEAERRISHEGEASPPSIIEHAAKTADSGLKGVSATLPRFRVFRHLTTGVCVVLCNVEFSPGFECVLGPTAADGTSITFSAALEFARDALGQSALKFLHGTYTDETSFQDLEEVSAKIKTPGFFGQATRPVT